MILQFCGLSGSGKSTLAYKIKESLFSQNILVEVLDGDEYRKGVCGDLGFSKEDRNTNIRRLGFIANRFSRHGIVAIICAINPYEDIRQEIEKTYENVHTIFINCSLDTLMQRDTKGLYRRASLPNLDQDKIFNLTGVNDPFDIPMSPALILNTHNETLETSVETLRLYTLSKL